MGRDAEPARRFGALGVRAAGRRGATTGDRQAVLRAARRRSLVPVAARAAAGIMHWLHHYATLLATTSLLLIAAGALVTSTGSGLAVPDWPNTYGHFMFAFPLSKMVGGIAARAL